MNIIWVLVNNNNLVNNILTLLLIYEMMNWSKKYLTWVYLSHKHARLVADQKTCMLI